MTLSGEGEGPGATSGLTDLAGPWPAPYLVGKWTQLSFASGSNSLVDRYGNGEKFMTFVAIPHCARVVVNWRFGTEDWANVFHATKTDYSLADQEALADAVDLSLSLMATNVFGEGVQYRNTTVYDMRSVGGAIVVNDDGTYSSTGAPAVMPTSDAVVVTLRTATRGRSGRGRVYVAGWQEGHWDNGAFNATATAHAMAYVGAVKAGIENSGFAMVIVSRQQNGVVLPTPATRPVTGYEVRSGRPGIQRRRVDRG